MVVSDAHVSWLSHTSPNTIFFQKPTTTLLTCFCRGKRRKYAGNKIRFKLGSNSKAPGHESNTLTTEPLGGAVGMEENAGSSIFFFPHNVFKSSLFQGH